MKIAVVVVGKAKGAVGEAIGEYEARARRYLIGKCQPPSLCESTDAAKFDCPSWSQQEMIDVANHHG
jgi:hypothetical protein